MRTEHDLNRAIRDLKHEEPEPLMSREAIVGLIAAQPVIQSQPLPQKPLGTAKPPAHRVSTPWIVAGTLAAAASIALLVVNVSDAPHEALRDRTTIAEQPATPARKDAATDLASAERTVNAESHGVVASEGVSILSDGATVKESQRQLAPLGKAETARKHSLPQPLAVQTIELSAEMLAPFGLSYADGAITYTEDGSNVTIRANGIAVRATKMSSKEPVIAPVMALIYHDEEFYAKWFDTHDPAIAVVQNMRSSDIKMNAATSMNDMIAIRVPLQPVDGLASKVDVVLWFPGTRQIAELLPSSYRQKVLHELGLAQTSSDRHYTVPDNASSAFVGESLVFPNPLRTGFATLRMQMKQPVVSTGIVTDMFGKVVATVWSGEMLEEGQNDRPLFGLDNVPTGVYNVIVTFDGSQERIVQRLMIQR